MSDVYPKDSTICRRISPLIDRRTFVKTSAAALPVAYLAVHIPVSYAEDPLTASQIEPGIPWQRKIRRVAQVNMTEHDPVVMDVEAWAAYMARLQVGRRLSV
jgi:hypothetical protein